MAAERLLSYLDLIFNDIKHDQHDKYRDAHGYVLGFDSRCLRICTTNKRVFIGDFLNLGHVPYFVSEFMFASWMHMTRCSSPQLVIPLLFGIKSLSLEGERVSRRCDSPSTLGQSKYRPDQSHKGQAKVALSLWV
jgi:hypothetical protein